MPAQAATISHEACVCMRPSSPESQVAIEGLPEGRSIALASPEQSKAQNKKGGGAMQAIPK